MIIGGSDVLPRYSTWPIVDNSVTRGSFNDNRLLLHASADQAATASSQARGPFDREIPRQALEGFDQEDGSEGPGRNPVMFVVLVGLDRHLLESIAHPSTFTWSITVWLFLTVIFANFAEAMAEGRGKAQADTLRKMRSETEARRLRPDGTEESCPRRRCKRATLSCCEANDLISPRMAKSYEGIASVDESAITGESAAGHP